ncbi:DUF1800 domain-containing protein [Portibacter marinus]|uniref:DUF1800 domain-containing protein n=1 Tax=Portibacter marinus TaxID=2898660 RepID=UPI001F3F2981|nr:DUF1800 domain-containing protein [Portibacter marinus]
MRISLCLYFFLVFSIGLWCQPDTVVIGFGGFESVAISSSDPASNPRSTLDQSGYLPNENAAARFLSQATLGYSLSNIVEVTHTGIEDWIDAQLAMPIGTDLTSIVQGYLDETFSALGTYDGASRYLYWEYSWWQYHMTNDDLLRQRVAMALSEILVISEKSNFGNSAFALADYYDILLRNAFGNYRDILQEVTYHPSMGVYLTYTGNPKTDVSQNRYPDENYAREIMQLFTIGLFELNNDGTRKLDGEGQPIPTYDNDDISEYSKVFTGLTWADGNWFFGGARNDTSYLSDLVMWEEYHEPGVKNLLRGEQIPDRNPVDGNADISDALDNLFNHPNVGPFVSKLLIQRLVTSNPSPAYINRVANVFNDNGSGVRGDMAAVIKAILLDEVANNCNSADDDTFGKLREPFIRYFHINKAFNASTLSGEHKNVMRSIERQFNQKPLSAPSVFNFFQPDYQPIGPIEERNLVAPEFQITDSQTITGWINGLYEWLINEEVVDVWQIYDGEPESNYLDEVSSLDFSPHIIYTNDDEIHILLDRLNLILAQGRITDSTLAIIKNALIQYDNESAEDKELRVKLAIYLIMSSPEYLINR